MSFLNQPFIETFAKKNILFGVPSRGSVRYSSAKVQRNEICSHSVTTTRIRTPRPSPTMERGLNKDNSEGMIAVEIKKRIRQASQGLKSLWRAKIVHDDNIASPTPPPASFNPVP